MRGARGPGIAEDPLWYKDAIIYQLHIKAFFDADGDGVGDFRGLSEKLDYIADLGATCIWLLPFFPSPMRDDGYDISDYRNVNPAYGTTHDVRQFVRAAHERGLRVLIELVVNHTSDQHPWFQRARRAKRGSVWRDFYVWSDSDKKYAGTRIIFTDTESSNWTWDPVAGQYYWHRFFAHQPDLNFANPRVIEAVLNVMRFWLDTGVDGLRLDAVPYLCEREGTNNENLPETHGVLKILRAVLDAEYRDRVFLAEANQWPEDVRRYFGDGDECHMAFHFPLMPRMFMAIAEEDRYPIIDIMRQTPEIPATCQWAIFLRNHDEMTLEMVTERERDHLYRIYASEPRARINVGIRRRLAPLMENDRRRIELMLGLLLSMPGTPIIYYGDEIGMGDNIYLSDRDGVRTPMQWSIDRNGGFSRADPAQLYLPPIQDPVYGYASVNVEAQSRSPSSLLNWLRKLIAVRQGSSVFGRGTLRFLNPSNRRVIAYLREHEGQAILCVANLAASAQQVALALGPWKARVPIEMLGWSSFEAVEGERYSLALPGHAFYWFWLAPASEAASRPNARDETLPDLQTLVLPREENDSLLAGTALARFEGEVVPGFLAAQRWYADKDRPLAELHLVDAARIDGPPRAFHTIVDARFADPDRAPRARAYYLPIAADERDEERSGALVRATLARTRRGARSGFVFDGFALEGFAHALLEDMRAERRLAGVRGGAFVARGSEALGAIDLAAALSVRPLEVEQSNTTVVVGERIALKGYRRLERGPQPELEIARRLASVGFRCVPAYLGSLEYLDASGEPTALAVAQTFVESSGDGWVTTLAYLERFLEHQRQSEASRPPGPEEYHAIYVQRAHRLGTRTAELHRALATPTDEPAFSPEATSEGDLADWQARASATLARAFEALARERARIPSELLPLVLELEARREALEARIAVPADELGALAQTRIHGDYHLGQILVVADDFAILDFEGEPSRTLAERRGKASPLRDVAGMLRSLDYAANAALLRLRDDRRDDPASRALARDWQARASRAFLGGYRESIAGCPSFPSDPTLAQALLDLFLLEKAAYEIAYELANRPAWLRIPLEGLRALLDGEAPVRFDGARAASAAAPPP
ncbi:MAG: maltose alpha-D-glucosyltransferase [Vulcanimicrobiaceae bacterium]